MMLNCIREEILYTIKSKIIFIIPIIFMLLFFSLMNGNYNNLETMLNEYDAAKQQLINDGKDWKKISLEEYNVEESDGFVSFDNPIAYQKDQVEKGIFVVSNKYLISALLEGVIMFSILIAFIGFYYASYDNGHNTLRIKDVKFDRVHIIMAKRIVMYFVITISILLDIVIMYVINSIHLKNFLGKCKNYAINPLYEKVIWILFFVLLISEVGFALGIVVKKTIIAAPLLVYYFIFSRGIIKYDFLRSLGSLINRHFDYLGTASGTVARDINGKEAMLVVIFVYIFIFTVSTIVLCKRSTYK